MTTQTVYEHRLTERAGSMANAAEPHPSVLLPSRGLAAVSPARLQGVSAVTPVGTPFCCSFCWRSASVRYELPATGPVDLCGAHALETLGDRPARAYLAITRAA